VGERHKLNSSSDYNFLLNGDIQKEDLLRKRIEKLEGDINVKDRVIAALEKTTPWGHKKLVAEHEKLQRDYDELKEFKESLEERCANMLKLHNFPLTFSGIDNLSQAFAGAKADVIRLTEEKENAIRDMELDMGDKLQQINMLFDLASEHYTSISFASMYNGLKTFLTNKDNEITTLKEDKENLTTEKNEFITNRNNLENKVNDLVGTEFELLDFRTKFLALEVLYNQAGLPKL